ncbi:hypothetical protein GPECTOR_19g302 [Gonium pectorale]|uniref:UBA domain-containing protein n=1 Tax=Gonium pectorale TaxID=33097 RepID=A0A150GJ73_GONPE|nr:hypothetical protein GPECTOR_19g302 [Gonium pectorale]|eukprot:KXZ49851.1 hypothetical protein GPECTOR_19g302 [Gonium pectorale]
MPSGSITTLRLKYSQEIRLDPRVPVSATLLQSVGPQAPVSVDLSLEKRLAEEDGPEASAGVAADVHAYLAGVKAGELPRDSVVQQLLATGVPPAAAVLGGVYGRGSRSAAEKAADFASKLEQLSTMGFPLQLAAGALAKHNADVEAATETCLLAGA